MSRTIQNILAAGKIKLCRLLDKASSSKTSQKYSKRILDAHDNARNASTRTSRKNTHVSNSSSSSVTEYLHISDSRKGVMILPYLRYVLRTSYIGRTEQEPHNIVALGRYQATQPTITHKLDNRLITNPNHGITPSVQTHP
jgi:hypothetical protein